MDPVVQADVGDEGLELFPAWDAPQPAPIDAYKLLVWICAIVTPWLGIATIAAVSVHVLS
jgi:hypothetical protein